MINKVTLLGKIGKKDFRPTKNGIQLCSLSIATSRKYLNSMGKREEIVTWHNVNFFNKVGELVGRVANVGDLIYIEGEISNKKIDENGINRIVHSIIGSLFKVINQSKEIRSLPDNIGNVAEEDSYNE